MFIVNSCMECVETFCDTIAMNLIRQYQFSSTFIPDKVRFTCRNKVTF